MSKILPLADAVLARGSDADDPVAATVARRHEQRTVRHRGDGAEASVFLIEEDLAPADERQSVAERVEFRVALLTRSGFSSRPRYNTNSRRTQSRCLHATHDKTFI